MNQYVRTVRSTEGTGRGGAVSLEVDLSTGGACPFACDYCANPRAATRAFPDAVDLRKLEGELRQALERHAGAAHDVTFTGSGEPTWSPQFDDALTVALACVRCFAHHPIPVRVVTCGRTLERPRVARALEALVRSGAGEVLIKLDAWDEGSSMGIEGARAFESAKQRIAGFARRVPVVQTVAMHAK
jgi:wyosine [tRNA(Phe)-imidazoG37] synthetase (radical SAM superfamily)